MDARDQHFLGYRCTIKAAILSTTNPTCQTWVRTRAASVGIQRLTASEYIYYENEVQSRSVTFIETTGHVDKGNI
jgi:hypothetical protein